jgi:predicted phosphodiesterase/predicted RNase H-like HicB family nuclease
LKLLRNKLVFTEEDGTWTAHDPTVEGVYGLGPTREAAKKDLAEALELLGDHVANQAEEKAQDAEDVAAADAAMDEVLAGGELYTHAEMLSHLGLDPDGKGDAEDAHLTDETKAKIRARLAEMAANPQKLVPLEEAMMERGLLPVRLGIVSDIHGDIVALDAALARLRKMGCDQILCAGDLLDLEPFGEEVVQRIKAEKIVCIRGNHERWALERRRRKPDPRKQAPLIVWEASDLFGGGANLSREALAFLATLPTSWSAEIAGVRVAMHHARVGSDMEGIRAETTGPALRRRLLDQAKAVVLVLGHTHDAFSLAAGKGKIVNPGSCCSKAQAFKQVGSLSVPDGYRPATFGVLELPSKRFRVFQVSDGVQVLGLAESGSMRTRLIRTAKPGRTDKRRRTI